MLCLDVGLFSSIDLSTHWAFSIVKHRSLSPDDFLHGIKAATYGCAVCALHKCALLRMVGAEI